MHSFLDTLPNGPGYQDGDLKDRAQALALHVVRKVENRAVPGSLTPQVTLAAGAAIPNSADVLSERGFAKVRHCDPNDLREVAGRWGKMNQLNMAAMHLKTDKGQLVRNLLLPDKTADAARKLWQLDNIQHFLGAKVGAAFAKREVTVSAAAPQQAAATTVPPKPAATTVAAGCKPPPQPAGLPKQATKSPPDFAPRSKVPATAALPSPAAVQPSERVSAPTSFDTTDTAAAVAPSTTSKWLAAPPSKKAAPVQQQVPTETQSTSAAPAVPAATSAPPPRHAASLAAPPMHAASVAAPRTLPAVPAFRAPPPVPAKARPKASASDRPVERPLVVLHVYSVGVELLNQGPCRKVFSYMVV